MKKLIFIVIATMLAGCNDPIWNAKFKCADGVIYIHDDGAWIQAMAYKDNKCLPEDDKK